MGCNIFDNPKEVKANRKKVLTIRKWSRIIRPVGVGSTGATRRNPGVFRWGLRGSEARSRSRHGLPKPRAKPQQSVSGFFFGAGVTLPNGNHAIHARHSRGVSKGEMEAGNGSCNAGLRSSMSDRGTQGQARTPFLLPAWGVGGASP